MADVSGATLVRIFFQKDDFAIAKFVAGDGGGFSAKGTFHSPQEGLVYDLSGRWETHAKYGRQLSVDTAQVVEPTDARAVETYIVDNVPGVGVRLAQKIVEAFGENALDTLRSAPEKVSEAISGLSLDVAKGASEALSARKDEEKLDLDLRSLVGGFVTKSALRRIRKQYGKQAISVLRSNPYQTIYDIEGIGFLTADKMAQHLGFERDSAFRVEAGIYHTLYEAAWSGGHTCGSYDWTIRAAMALLGVAGERVQEVLVDLQDGEKPRIVIEGDQVYLRKMLLAEKAVARRLSDLMASAPRTQAWTDEAFAKAHLPVPESFELLKEDQIAARETAIESKVFVLTGAPGTGKTTALRALIESFGPETRTLMCAPSGKAAKRMAEQTGRPAGTIHRTLEAQPTDQGGFVFARSSQNPLDVDLLVVDEVSMVDILLMRSLLEALPNSARLVLVGDHYQLPSIGPGNVLRDLIDSGVVPTVELTVIKRQDPGLIVRNCHAIKDGRMLESLGGEGEDFWFHRADSPKEVQDTVVDLVTKTIPSLMQDDPEFDILRDVQVITGTREKTELSCKALNELLQGQLNENSESEDYQFRQGDKVIQLKNATVQDRRSGEKYPVVNGDIGYVRELVSRPRSVVVDFENPDRQICMPAKSVERDLAYALTVHKFQGSESKVVVIPVHKCFGPRMLQRNWLYTAISRAAKLCIIVGQTEAVKDAVGRNDNTMRHTRLKPRLRAEIEAHASKS